MLSVVSSCLVFWAASSSMIVLLSLSIYFSKSPIRSVDSARCVRTAATLDGVPALERTKLIRQSLLLLFKHNVFVDGDALVDIRKEIIWIYAKYH